MLLVRAISISFPVSYYLLTLSGQRVGDKTPADLLIFSSTDLKVDNSSLTGEAEPQERGPNHKGANVRPVEAENLVRSDVLWLNGHSSGGRRLSTRLWSSTAKHGAVGSTNFLVTLSA